MLSATSEGPKSTSCKVLRDAYRRPWARVEPIYRRAVDEAPGTSCGSDPKQLPIGLKHNTTCRLCRTLPMKYSIMLSDVSATPSAFAAFRNAQKWHHIHLY